MSTVNVPPIFAAPLGAGMCTMTELHESVTLDDVLDMVEVLQVRAENERRHQRFAERRAAQQRRRMS